MAMTTTVNTGFGSKVLSASTGKSAAGAGAGLPARLAACPPDCSGASCCFQPQQQVHALWLTVRLLLPLPAAQASC